MTRTPPPPAAPPAGWYADPTGATVQRYWDGDGWTEFLARSAMATLPSEALERERTAWRWARIALVLMPLLVTLASVVSARYLHDVFDRIDFSGHSSGSSPAFSLGGIGVQILGYAAGACIAVLAWWSYRSAQTARTLGITLRREPGWALASWFIPIISYWWPPQNIRRFVADDELVPRLWWWWAAYLTALGLETVTFFVGIFTLDALAPLAVVVLVVSVTAALLGFQVLGAVVAAHERVLRERGLDDATVPG